MENSNEREYEDDKAVALKRSHEDDVETNKTHHSGETETEVKDVKPESNETDDKGNNGNSGFSLAVANHYNAIEETGIVERTKSRIFYLRNFNNWIKSMLISENLQKVRDSKYYGAPIKVLDMCCGKGGDLIKWSKGNIKHLICADIAGTSIEQCQTRYKEMNRSGFTAEFIVADCTRDRLREKFHDPSIDLDLVSCQFSFHYCFESLPQVRRMLENTSDCLKKGGYFIGTMPDAGEIVQRFRESEQIGNDIYKIEVKCSEPFPLFGAQYDFYLEGVVNCPEFLVHFPVFVKLALEYKLKLVKRQSFKEFFKSNVKEGQFLMQRMQALESFPPDEGTNCVGKKDEGDYKHVEEFLEKNSSSRQVGTLSKPEWEAVSLYQVFVFVKE